MKLYSPDGSELMNVEAVEAENGKLIIKGKVFGSMPMSARLTPEEARKGLRFLNPKLVFFLLTFLFRKS